MRSRSPLRVNIARHEGKEQALKAFVQRYIAPRDGGGTAREIQVVARSMESPVVQAIAGLGEEIAGVNFGENWISVDPKVDYDKTRAGLIEAVEPDLGGAEGKTVNIGARNDEYGEGLAGTFSDGWEKLGGSIGQEVIYDPEQPSYNSEAQQIVSGNPDAIVIIDFPETFIKVAPALQRTGQWDPNKAWGTDGIASSLVVEEVPAQVLEGIRGSAPGALSWASSSAIASAARTCPAPADADRTSTRPSITSPRCPLLRQNPSHAPHYCTL